MRASFQKLSVISLAALVTGVLLLPLSVAGRSGGGGGGSRIFELEYMDVNSVEIPLTNYGPHGQNIAGSAGTYWPRGTGMPYIFGAGIWVGALKGNDTLVSVGYNPVDGNFEFYPGPPEHNADHAADANSHPEDRIYFSTDPADLAEWPVKDSLGENIVLSHQDAYCYYNDGNQFAGDSLNITVTQHAFAWNTPLLKDMVFILYTIKNNDTLNPVERVYVGADADDDIGYADDDLLGLDIGRSLGYCYTTGQEAGWDAPPPYFVGVRFLQGPKTSDTVLVGDPANPDTVIYPGEHLVLTAFKKCTRNIEPGTDGNRYMFLAGYDFTTGEYAPFDSVDTAPGDKRKILAAGPFDLAPGALDTLLIAIMFSNGTTGGLDYLLSQGDAAQTLYELGWVIPLPPEYPHVTLIPGDGKVTVSWDNYAETQPDAYRAVMEAGGDTLYAKFDVEGYYILRSRTGRPEDWDTLVQCDKENGITLLPDGTENGADEGLSYTYDDLAVYNGFTYYYGVIAYDYNTTGEGANIPNYLCQARAPQTELTVTPRSEIANDITAPTSSIAKAAGATEACSLEVNARAANIVLGHGYELSWGTIIENAGLPVYTYGIRDTDTSIVVLTDVWAGAVEASHSRAFFEDTVSVDTLAADSIEVTTFSIDTLGLYWEGDVVSPLFDGLELTGMVSIHRGDSTVSDTTVSLVDSTGAVVSDTTIWSDMAVVQLYSADSLEITTDAGNAYTGNLSLVGILPDKEWAFHGGSTYEIRWEYYNNSPDTLTVEVWDIENDHEVPFGSELGDNWCFGPQSPVPPLVYSEYITQDNGLSRSMLYICGVKYWLNNGGYPMPWDGSQPAPGEVWTAYNTGDYVPCRGNLFTILSGSPQIGSEGKTDWMDRIKVVPNPYVVRNDWEVSRDYARIQFTHLPAECTIRIYTLAGNLIKTIRHEVTESELSEQGGTVNWNVLTDNNQIPASGVYIYYVSSPIGQKMGKFAVIK